VGLVLTGGGARAAYQVGVLKALMDLRQALGGADGPNPFPVLCGTSAGAINAAALACLADDMPGAVDALVRIWSGFHAGQVFRADALSMARQGAQWLSMLSVGWVMPRSRLGRPRSLLDNAPLADLLQRELPLHRLDGLLAQGHLQALAVSASSYTHGDHVTFYQAAHAMQPWTRSQRRSLPVRIDGSHLMASAAIPFVFPARRLHDPRCTEWFGDGSMRQTAPISPAIHLGAQRVLVIAAGRLAEPPGEMARDGGYPSLAQIAGHAMASIFLDTLAVDIERLQRINRTLALLPLQARDAAPLRPVQALVIAPSQRLDTIAARHAGQLPSPVRAMLRGVGIGASAGEGDDGGPAPRGAALVSYLLFEAAFTQELIALGEADTLARRDEVAAFFGWGAGAGSQMAAA
jgi:NTE family protein